MPAVRAVEWDCQWFLKHGGNFHRSRQFQPMFRSANHERVPANSELKATSHTPLTVLTPPGKDRVAFWGKNRALRCPALSIHQPLWLPKVQDLVTSAYCDLHDDSTITTIWCLRATSQYCLNRGLVNTIHSDCIFEKQTMSCFTYM